MMTTTMTTSRSAGYGCGGGCGGGCSCGGSPAVGSAAFTRPRFFAGQLLTEDDLEQLTAYITGKDRLRNRMLFGPGVVSGLEVVCAPCGGGDVVVRPGYALDCCGNEIVVGCPETVSITELVNELRVRGLGVDCGDPCVGGSTSGKAETTGEHPTRAPRYGLYVRYAEADAEPVAPYATQEPCPPVGCVPSRIREGFAFLVKCACADPPDHRYRPGDLLLRELGDPPGTRQTFASLWSRGRRLDQYRERMRAAAAAEDEAIVFKDADAARFSAALDELTELMNEVGQTVPATGTIETARQITETVRALAAAVARYDLGDAGRQQRLLQRYPDLNRVGSARDLLGRACTWLRPTLEDPVAGSGDPPLPELTWPDPALRGIAHAVVEQTLAQVGWEAAPTPMELRLVALGAPLDRPLRSDLRTDLGRLRDWLLIRLETSADVTSCALRADVAGIAVPLALPQQAQGDDGTVKAGELKDFARAADQVYSALYRFVADLACGCLPPPPLGCTDTDVLLATVEVEDCTVVRICSAGREQVLPGGAAYGAWLTQLPLLRELTGRFCCGPVPKDCYVEEKGEDGGISLPYVPGWLLGTDDSDLGRLLAVLGAIPASRAAATAVRPRPAVPAAQQAPATDPAPAPAPDPELADLRDRLAAVTARLAALESRPEPAPVLVAAPAPVPPRAPAPDPPPAPAPAPVAAPPPEPAPAPSPAPDPRPAPVKRAKPAKKAAAKKTAPAATSTAKKAAATKKATSARDSGDQNPGA
jgi:hypothetical protein